MRLLLTAILFSLLAACASSPGFNTRGVDPSLTPEHVLDTASESVGKTVLWGGIILNTSNRADNTLIEVLTYPLDRQHRPQRDLEPMGRILIENPGFLEPAIYAQGKLISVVGTLGSPVHGNIGMSSYDYPVVQAQQVHLWDTQNEKGRSNIHFGIGIGIGL